MLLPDTSSVIPTVNRRRGRCPPISANTPATIAGVNSFDDNPYRPPDTRGNTANSPSAYASFNAATTSRNNGSPIDPGSFVRSNTPTRVTDGGNASNNSRAGNGRYNRTCTTPT